MSQKFQVDAAMKGFKRIGKRNVVEPDGKVVVGTFWRHEATGAIVLQFSGNQWLGLNGDYRMDSENRLFDENNEEIVYFGSLVWINCLTFCLQCKSFGNCYNLCIAQILMRFRPITKHAPPVPIPNKNG